LKTLIITPACNEEEHLEPLIHSMIKQSILPEQWIIVDDGSLDNTSDIIKKFSIQNPWIKYLRKEKKSGRSPGKSVMEAFYHGYNNKDLFDYDIVMKLDADLVLPANYLESIIQCFNENPKVGICGGVCVLHNGDDYIVEGLTNLDHIRGAIKAYRKSCFSSISGLLKVMGWDTVDEHHARFNGWEVCVLKNIQVIHQRATNQEYGLTKAAFKNGKMLYSIRMDLVLLLLNCLKRSFTTPYLILGLYMLWGYCIASWNSHDRIVSKELGVFIRKYRYKKLFEKFF
tara:strand:+ start:1553 stop:2407 length:855 start_codon:yes stop_codon:yes gene_type:complete